MCEVCSDLIKKEFPSGHGGQGFKLSKEEQEALPGKKLKGKKIKDATPEEAEAHRLFRRGYERLYREWDRANGGALKKYQKRYSEIYRQIHAEELFEYYRNYVEANPEYVVRATNRRADRLKLVPSEKYTIEDVIATWGTICYICNKEIDLEAPRHPNFTGWELGLQPDHVIPLHLGGPDTLDNVKPTHGICNNRKSHQVLTELTDEQLQMVEEFQQKYPSAKRGRPLLG